MENYPYDQIRPFDVIMYKGSSVFSGLISLVEKIFIGNGEWTHIGLVVTTELLPGMSNVHKGKLYVYESLLSHDDNPDIESGNPNFGVQIRDLAKSVKLSNADPEQRVAWCKLLNNPLDKKDTETDDEYKDRINTMKTKLADFYNKNKSTSYDYNPLSLIKIVFPCFWNPVDQDTMYFCSELVTEIYQLIGLVDKSLNPETLSPVEVLQYKTLLFDEPVMLTI